MIEIEEEAVGQPKPRWVKGVAWAIILVYSLVAGFYIILFGVQVTLK